MFKYICQECSKEFFNKLNREILFCSVRCQAKKYRRTTKNFAPEQSQENFEKYILANAIQNNDGCIEWCGTRDKKGYGYSFVPSRWLSHRLSIYLSGKASKSDLEGMCVLHKCDNPPCINPEHLFLGTNVDNVADRVRKGRNKFADGELCGHSKLKNADVIFIRRAWGELNMHMEELSSLFDVHRSTIEHICYGRTWKNLLPQPNPDKSTWS